MLTRQEVEEAKRVFAEEVSCPGIVSAIILLQYRNSPALSLLVESDPLQGFPKGTIRREVILILGDEETPGMTALSAIVTISRKWKTLSPTFLKRLDDACAGAAKVYLHKIASPEGAPGNA